MDSVKLAKKVEKDVIKMRRHFHENPESSMHEKETMEYVAQTLENLGIKTEKVKDGGLIGTLQGQKGGKTLILRSDLDALAMKEATHNLKKKKVVVANTDKAAHMCGHDAHMAMLLGAAEILAKNKAAFKGKILFAFEQGEEKSGGIQNLLRRLVEIGADSVWGMHVKSDLESGKLSVEAGPRMSSIYPFHVEITGTGGHGSRPDLSVSPLDCFHDFYGRLQTARLTEMNPFDPITYSIGNVQAGMQGVANVIPERLEFHGTARFLQREQGKLFFEYFKKSLDEATAAYGGNWRFLKETEPMNLLVYNNVDCSRIAATAVQNNLGKKVLSNHPAWMASEPFAFYQRYFPGVFAFLGIENEKKGTGAEHHNDKFDVDEDVLSIGVAATVQYTLDFLAEKSKIKFNPEKRSVDQLFDDIKI